MPNYLRLDPGMPVDINIFDVTNSGKLRRLKVALHDNTILHAHIVTLRQYRYCR